MSCDGATRIKLAMFGAEPQAEHPSERSEGHNGFVRRRHIPLSARAAVSFPATPTQ